MHFDEVGCKINSDMIRKLTEIVYDGDSRKEKYSDILMIQ